MTFLRYGSYRHQVAECAISVVRTPQRNEGDFVYQTEERWSITGFVQASDQAGITAAVQQLQTAYAPAQQGMAVGLFFDDGTPTPHGINVAQTLGGVRVVGGPSFTEGKGAELSTYRSYSLDLEFIVPAVPDCLLAFVETLSFEGGYDRWIFMNLLEGAPQRQEINELVPQRIIQEGSAIGYRSYFRPAPLFPAIEHRELRRIRRKSPKRKGPIGRPVFCEYEINWSYTFESAVPLDGVPNRWF